MMTRAQTTTISMEREARIRKAVELDKEREEKRARALGKGVNAEEVTEQMFGEIEARLDSCNASDNQLVNVPVRAVPAYVACGRPYLKNKVLVTTSREAVREERKRAAESQKVRYLSDWRVA